MASIFASMVVEFIFCKESRRPLLTFVCIFCGIALFIYYLPYSLIILVLCVILISKSNKHKIADDYNQKGLKLMNEKRFEEAEMQFKKGLILDSRNTYINHNLGFLYKSLDNPARNINKALQHFNISANNGYKYSYRELGHIYSPICENFGVQKDIELALKYYHKSAEQRDADSCNSIGCLYSNCKKEYYKGSLYTWFAFKYDPSNKLYKENYEYCSSKISDIEKKRIESMFFIPYD